MPIQVYNCEEHGEFEVNYDISETVCSFAVCPHAMNTTRRCGLAGTWVPQVVSFHVDGGTGAQRSPR